MSGVIGAFIFSVVALIASTTGVYGVALEDIHVVTTSAAFATAS